MSDLRQKLPDLSGPGSGSSMHVLSAATLPPEVFVLIFSKLEVKKDRLAFLAVCRSWRHGCGAALSSLSLPWPVSAVPADLARRLKHGEGRQRMRLTGDDTAQGGGSGGQQASNDSPLQKDSQSFVSRGRLPVKNGSSLSVKWLRASLKLFNNITSLELTVPVPPESLTAIAHLPLLHTLDVVLRPPPSAVAIGASDIVVMLPDVQVSISQGSSRIDPYELAFTNFIIACSSLRSLTMSMRACRWETWPVLPAPLLGQLATSLPHLTALHIKSPLFVSHGLSHLLSLERLTSLTLPLDVPYFPSEHAPLSDLKPPFPLLTELQLQPYVEPYRKRMPAAPWHLAGGLYGERSSHALPAIVSTITALKTLQIRGYGRSALLRAELINNTLSSIPDLTKLQQLRHLELSSLRELEEFPPSACHLPALACITIQDCPALLRLPEELGCLGNSLQELWLHSLGLHSLPQSLSTLSQLRKLSASHLYWLESLPEDLGSLQSLELLRVVSCKRLTALPSSLNLLHRLQALVLSFNMFSLSPSLLSGFPLLSSLTLTLCCPRDLEVGPALAALPSLTELQVTMADDGAGMSISGADLVALLPVSEHLERLKIEDVRSTSYAGTFLEGAEEEPLEADMDGSPPRGDGILHEPEGAGDGDPVDPAVPAQQPGALLLGGALPAPPTYSLNHFIHGPYPTFSGLKALSIKCAWLSFQHESFPELEVLDLVLLCHSNGRRGGHRSASRGRSPGLQNLINEVLRCQSIRSFTLFTPEAPDVLSAPRSWRSQDSKALADGFMLTHYPPRLQCFLVNGMDMLPVSHP